MVTVDEAWRIIDRETAVLPAVRLGLAEAAGRVLREDIAADADQPPFTRSAMDGYAVRTGSEPGRYRLAGEVRPGVAEARVPEAGEALRIFTGSALPEEGVEIVIIENTALDGDSLEIKDRPSARWVRRRGSQARRGNRLVRAGTVLSPGAIALMATVGAVRPLVSPPIRAMHLGTGSEIVPAAMNPPAGCIRDSNAPLIAALLGQAGAQCVFHAHVSEEVSEAVKALENMGVDMLLVSGGASVGAYDGTAEIFRRLGFASHFTKVSCRPGKPLIFATRGAQVAFGLPGNPLSHFVCFHLFVRRALDRLAGAPLPPLCRVQITGEAPPADPRETWWPARVFPGRETLCAEPLPWRESSDVTSLALANALLRIPPSGVNGLAEARLFGNLSA